MHTFYGKYKRKKREKWLENNGLWVWFIRGIFKISPQGSEKSCRLPDGNFMSTFLWVHKAFPSQWNPSWGSVLGKPALSHSCTGSQHSVTDPSPHSCYAILCYPISPLEQSGLQGSEAFYPILCIRFNAWVLKVSGRNREEIERYFQGVRRHTYQCTNPEISGVFHQPKWRLGIATVREHGLSF